MAVEKLVVDAAPLLSQTRDELYANAKQLYTTPAVLAEIKDESARQRLELWKDELKVQQPSAAGVKFVTDFARKTGDLAVLSSPDIGIIALTYDLHSKEGLHSSPQIIDGGYSKVVEHNGPTEKKEEPEETPQEDDGFTVVKPKQKGRARRPPVKRVPSEGAEPSVPAVPVEEMSKLSVADSAAEPENEKEKAEVPKETGESKETEKPKETEEDSDSDWSDDGWITADNLTEKLAGDGSAAVPVENLSAALASRDFAVQNVALQIGLPVINDAGLRVTSLKTYMQRCHACFNLVPMDKSGVGKQFCPRCGGHTLTRVTVTVQDGELHLHLKANMQWKTRGDRYTLPTPQSRRARRERHDAKIEMYAEDQPEYLKAVKTASRQQRRNEKMFDDWVGPGGVLEAGASPFLAKREMSQKVHIGKGRNANAKGH